MKRRILSSKPIFVEKSVRDLVWPNGIQTLLRCVHPTQAGLTSVNGDAEGIALGVTVMS